MNSSSIYKGDFSGKMFEKLPSIYQNREQNEEKDKKKTKKIKNIRGWNHVIYTLIDELCNFICKKKNKYVCYYQMMNL